MGAGDLDLSVRFLFTFGDFLAVRIPEPDKIWKFDVRLWRETTYLAVQVIDATLSILHLQRGLSVCSFKDGASVLPLSALEARDYMKISWPSQLRLFEDSPRSAFFPAKVSGAWVFSGYKSHTIVDDGVMGMCFSREMTTLRWIERDAQVLLPFLRR